MKNLKCVEKVSVKRLYTLIPSVLPKINGMRIFQPKEWEGKALGTVTVSYNV